MFGQDLIVRTRLIPPRPPARGAHLIPRPRLNQRLSQITAYPLTVIRAPAGYGKTTAIASFLTLSSLPHFWYSIGDTEADPLVFLLHLIHAFRTAYPKVGERSLALLSQEGGAMRLWAPAVDNLVNDLLDVLSGETVLVLDDYCLVNQPEINAITQRFIEHMPPRLHLVITTRTMLNLPGQARWRASGELLEIGRPDLAFTPEEIAALFAQRTGQTLNQAAARVLATETEGWPIAVQMLSESVDNVSARTLDDLLRYMPRSLELLFDYLAEEVFLRQPRDVQTFLAETAGLRRLDPGVCNYVADRTDSEALLRYLHERSLFLMREGDRGYRYHHLFREFLLRRGEVPVERRRTLHSKAAAYYLTQGDREEAVYHLLAAEDHASAAKLLATIARPMAHSGRHQTLAAWLDQLPPDLLEVHPELLLARGHAYRYASRYREALAAYARAQQRFEARGDSTGEARALRGQALVYLDTVQPARADPLLRRALRKIGRHAKDERARLLILLAENKINLGQLPAAERLHHAVYCAARRDDFPPMDPRVYVRDGRFALARQIVESNLRTDPWGIGHWRAPRSHREAAVLLAWIDAMTGQAESARRYAAQSLELGQTLRSPIVECVSLSRLGHAWLTGPDFDLEKARAYYRDSLIAAIRIDVPRFKVESLLGLTLIAGLEGKIAEAEANAREALAILEETGDRYMTGILSLALGAAMTLCDRPDAEDWLNRAARLGQACGDRFSPCLADLWRAIRFSRLGQAADAIKAFARALQTAQRFGYDFLFTTIPLLGPKDFNVRLMLLEEMLLDRTLGAYAARLRDAISPQAPRRLSRANPATVPLYVQTLGPFRVWRDGREIERTAWEREKALHLLQYLICQRRHLTHREQILEALWPDSSPPSAAIGLRVALSTLRKALGFSTPEGGDRHGDFIRREGESLRLDPSLGIRVDADEFESLIRSAQALEAQDPAQAIKVYESALALYRGDFLEENPYAEWAGQERERLRMLYLSAAGRVAELLVMQESYEEASQVCQEILRRDCCSEEAYYVLMLCYWKQGKRSLALRTYQRCEKWLRQELDVSPSPRTIELLQVISEA